MWNERTSTGAFERVFREAENEGVGLVEMKVLGRNSVLDKSRDKVANRDSAQGSRQAKSTSRFGNVFHILQWAASEAEASTFARQPIGIDWQGG